MKVIPTASGRRINTYSSQQNPNFGRAIVVKSKDPKLLEMLEHIDFLFWSENKPKYKYKGNIALDTYKNESKKNVGKKRTGNKKVDKKRAVFEGVLADDVEASTLRRFAGLIKKAFFNKKNKEYNRLVREESKFLNKIKQKANNAGYVVEIKSVEDLLQLPMLQENRVQIENCLKTFPTDDIN